MACHKSTIPSRTSRFMKSECTGYATKFRHVMAGTTGHTIMVCTVGHDDTRGLYICGKCGVWAETQPKLLALPCKNAATYAGKRALRDIGWGRHPLQKGVKVSSTRTISRDDHAAVQQSLLNQ